MSTTSRDPGRDLPREVELKLGLSSEAAYAQLRAALDTAGRFVRSVRQGNFFFDGLRGELTSARLSLRVRTERSDTALKSILTLKSGGVSNGAVSDRAEWECPLPLDVETARTEPSRLLALDLDPIRELKRCLPGLEGLRLLGGFANDRRVYQVPLDLAGTAATVDGTARRIETTWELDRSEFPDGSVDFELEVELGRLPSPEAVISAIHAELARLGVPTSSQPLSKYARFRERTRT
jgi:hypothetical protein